MTQIIPFSSGKGGVGKSLLVANLALSLSKAGRTVVLIDMDLGAANLHTFLKMRNNKTGIGNLIHRQEQHLQSLIIPTPYDRLYFIPGDNLLPETANHPFHIKKKLLKEIHEMTADYVFLDLGAGTSFNVMDYMIMVSQPVVVIIPEPTSILNAYSLIKNALFRLLIRKLPAKSKEREYLKELLLMRIEGTDWNLEKITAAFKNRYPHFAPIFDSLEDQLYPHVIINMGRGKEDIQLCLQLRKMCSKNLSLNIKYFGFLHYDENMHYYVKQREAIILKDIEAPFSQDIQRLADAFEMKTHYKGKPSSIEMEDDDLLDFLI